MTTDQTTQRKSLRRRHLLQRQTIIFGTLITVIVATGLAAIGVFTGILPPPFDAEWTDLDAEAAAALTTPCPPDGALPVAYSAITVNVLNGSGKNGMAASTAGTLTGTGIAVATQDNYKGETFSGSTRITVNESTVAAGYTLAPFFPDAQIVLDPAHTAPEIEIVLGQSFTQMTDASLAMLDPATPLVVPAGCTPITETTQDAA